jgi:8-oxo-dGTP pyrophosphatase MutT (NUDIX family)
MRKKRVIVAIVQDAWGRFLITYNPKWDGYAFPMKDLEDGADVQGSVAIQALEDDLGFRLPNARAEELEYLGRVGRSGTTGDETQYEYWVYAVDPGQPLNPTVASGTKVDPPMFLGFSQLTSRTDLTWSSTHIVREFVENQEAVLAVVLRPGDKETEFLLVWNNNYDGYFFPTQRVKTEVKPEKVAVATVRGDLGYRGPATAIWRGEVPDIHFSNRFFRDRRFRFHVCEVQLPEVDLHQPRNPLERALAHRGRQFLWLPGSRLDDLSIQFSPTMPVVRQTVLGLIPPQVLTEPLRRSEGGIALIQRTIGGKSEWLAQWNENWGSFFFVGGHRHEKEIFHECVIREIEEELGLSAQECPVANQPGHHLEYRAVSRSANELTNYTMELFEAHPTQDGLKKIADDTANKWLDETEIRRLEAYDGRAVSISMMVILGLANLLP